VFVIFSALAISACGRSGPEPGADAIPEAEPERPAMPELPEVEIPDELAPVLERWTGDLDGMLKRRRIRVGVVHSSFFLYFDQGRPRGVTYELLRQFEAALNKRLGLRKAADQIHVVLVPVRRDRMLPWLLEGQIDLATSNLTVTADRSGQVDFSLPFTSDVQEIVVTGPSAAPIRVVDDLAGRSVLVRASSSYFDSLQSLNADFAARGLEPVDILPAYEVLEDEDILGLVAAGLAEATVVDSHKALFFEAAIPGLQPHPELSVRENADIAWAFRKNSPKLAAEVNHFVAGHKVGTLIGNVLVERYVGNRHLVVDALDEEARQLLSEEADLFRKYGRQYDIHWLMLAAQAYQESGLDQSRRSRSGAVGVMQIKPSTARDKNVGIKDVSTLEGNIHAGTKYLRFLMDRYFGDAHIGAMDQWLLGLAAYNAGPARVAGLRTAARKAGLDPDRWFDNVELIAAQRIGRETVTYVRNVVSYYLAYRLAFERTQLRAEARRQFEMSGD
jgi:membrane-bound lytic murein transglycosylase MltF